MNVVINEQSKLQRFVLLAVLAYEGFGGILGGILLTLEPNGSYMNIPVEIMHGAFHDFLIPGLILTAMGVLNVAALIAVYRRDRIDWVLSGLALVGFVIWFAVEIAILHEVHWLHIMWGVPVLVGIWAAIPLIPRRAYQRINR